MSEYELLRNEIIECYDAIKNYNIAMYAAVVTVLTFALGKNNFLYCLVPYVAIIPLYFASESKNRNICKIAAYMNVFLEGNEYNWERLHHKYDEQFNKKRNWKSISQYYFLSIICSVIAITKIFQFNYDTYVKWILLSIVLIISIVAIIAMGLSTINYLNCRKAMLENWKKIKSEQIN